MLVGLYIIGLVMLAGVGYIIYLNISNRTKEDPRHDHIMVDLLENLRKEVQNSSGKNREELQLRLDKISEQITLHQQSTTSNLQKQFQQSSKLIQDVTEKLSEFEGTNKQILNFAEQMKSLENILQNPKQRGILGEYFLEALLSNVLAPAQYKMQYKFTNGEIVDAAVFVNEGIVPVDAKFSLEKYNQLVQTTDKLAREKIEQEFKRDIKNRIDETSKYIRPNENTTDFAIMFIPAEGIYYNLLIYEVGTIEINTQDLIEYAFKKKVMIASPTSFYAILSTILHGLNALKMEESIKEVLKKVSNLGRHLNSYEDHINRLGRQLGTVVATYDDSLKEFKKIDKDILKISDGKEGGKFEAKMIDKPREMQE